MTCVTRLGMCPFDLYPMYAVHMLICVGTAACVLRCLQVERVLSELLDASDRRAVFEGLEPRMGTHFCSLLQRVLETEYARGMAAGRDAEQRAQLAMVQHQASQSRRSRGRRGRSRGPGSEKSYGPSNEASMEDFDSDEDGMVSRQRSRVSHMRSEVSFDPSMWAGDDSDDDEYDEDDCGIGASFRPQPDGQVHCIGLLNGGPAEQSGLLQTGDIVLKVDNAAVHGMTHSEVQDRIMGPAESLVELEIQRDDELLTIEIRRDWTSNPKKARAMPQASGEFDPSIYAGSTSDEDSEEDTDQECGIGMSVGLDEMGLYRVTEVVLGGAADSTDDVCVGDILEGIDDVLISTCLCPPPPRVSLALSDSLSLACAFSLSLSLSRHRDAAAARNGPPARPPKDHSGAHPAAPEAAAHRHGHAPARRDPRLESALRVLYHAPRRLREFRRDEYGGGSHGPGKECGRGYEEPAAEPE